MDGLQERHIDTKRGIHYRYYVSPPSTQSDPSKPVILLLHGFPDSAALWQFVVPHLIRFNLRIVAPDLLGYGGSSKPTTPEYFNIGLMIRDLVEVLEAERINSPVIPMGHDWGAFTAMRFYMLEIERCAGLITLAVAWMPPATQDFDLDAANAFTKKQIGYPLYAYWELFLASDGPQLLEDHLESVWVSFHGDEKDWMKKQFCEHGTMRDFLSQDRNDVPLKRYARDDTLKTKWIEAMKEGGFVSPCCWYRAFAEHHHSATEKTLVNKVDKPYLFIGSTGDAVCRADFINQPKEEGVFKDLSVFELESGHWSPLERPDEVGHITTEWLREKGFAG